MNTVAKGRRIEKLARDKLIKDGWLVEHKSRSMFQSPDFWELFDIIAIKKNKMRLVQVKSNISGFYTARKEIKKWIAENDITFPCEIWLYLGRGKWRNEVASR
jgi:hypothetical protein